MASAAAAAAASAPLSLATTAIGPILAGGKAVAAAVSAGAAASTGGATATAIAANGLARMPAAIGVPSSAGTQAAAIAATAAVGRARRAPSTGREHCGPMQLASASEVIVIDDSDDEPVELAAGVLGAGEGCAVFQQRGELRGRARVKQDTDTEVGSASAAAEANEICSVQAAVLGGGVPAAPMQEAVDAQAALAAARERMATNQRLRGCLEPLNGEGVVRKGATDIAGPRAPGKVAIAAGAGDSSGDVAGTAAAAVCLVVPGREFPLTAAVDSNGHSPLVVGLSGGGPGGPASANLRTNAASGCSAGGGGCYAFEIYRPSHGPMAFHVDIASMRSRINELCHM